MTYSYRDGYFSRASAFLTPEYLDYYFNTITNTDKTRNKICEVSESCEGVNVGLTRKECVGKLKELPVVTNGRYFDGNDRGCRLLHAAFAETDKEHCPHISFEPLEDSKGKLKCQTSSNIKASDYFDELMLKDYVSTGVLCVPFMLCDHFLYCSSLFQRKTTSV